MSDPVTPANDDGANTPAAPAGPQSLEEALAELEKVRQEADKYKGLMRSEETKKKTLYEELQTIKQSQMSDAEKAIAEAEARGREAAKADFSEREKKLKLEAAAATVGIPEELRSILDVNKLVVDGEVNTELLKTLSGNQARPTFEKSARDLGIGAQSNGNGGQLTRQDLQGMTPQEIDKARKDGRCNAMMKGEI